MKTPTAAGITRNAIARMSKCKDPRLKQIVRSLTNHLHDFAREVKLTPEEWLAGIEFLTAVGHITDEKRQEFILLSDTLGLSAVVDLMANRKGESTATDSSLLGPFFRQGAPMFPIDGDISHGASGEKLMVAGRVLNTAGEPVAGALIDTWQASSDGIYDLQQKDSDQMNFRGRLRTGADGRFRFRSVKPSSYPVPSDGPVGKMLRTLARHPYRPAHVHFKIAAPGYRTLTTALYVAGDRYLDSDVVFGAKKSLVVSYRGSGRNGAASTIEFDFVLDSKESTKKGRRGQLAASM
jgi:protocatechuate 3,4-dioxygenase beta subunit